MNRPPRGSATVEAVLVVPLLVLFCCWMVALGRLALSRGEVDAAARAAARAASIERDPAAAPGAAEAAARSTLDGRGRTCSALSVATDTSAFVPGGQVAVTVTCAVKLSDLAPLTTGDKQITRRFAEPIDRFRGVGP